MNVLIFYKLADGVIQGMQQVDEILSATQLADLETNCNHGIIQVCRMDPNIATIDIYDTSAMTATFTVSGTPKKLTAV